jgi:hypothetical protein
MQLVQFCPALFVLKEVGRVKYPNPAYISIFAREPQQWRAAILHKTIEDLSPVSGKYIAKHEAEARNKSMKPVIESVQPGHRDDRFIFRAIRFPVPKHDGYTADFSFDWRTITSEAKAASVDWDLLKQQDNLISDDVCQMVLETLDEAPVAIALKRAATETRDRQDRGKIIQWCNKQFVASAQRISPKITKRDIEGKLSSLDIWKMGGNSPLALNEREVQGNKWLYDELDYGDGFVRTSLRYPIYEAHSAPVWIVSISVDFALDRHEETFSS